MGEAGIPDTSYTEAVAYLNNNLVTPEFQAAVAKFMDRERLMGLYRAGIYTDSLEYRRIYKNQVRWMKAVMYLMQIGDGRTCIPVFLSWTSTSRRARS